MSTKKPMRTPSTTPAIAPGERPPNREKMFCVKSHGTSIIGEDNQGGSSLAIIGLLACMLIVPYFKLNHKLTRQMLHHHWTSLNTLHTEIIYMSLVINAEIKFISLGSKWQALLSKPKSLPAV